MDLEENITHYLFQLDNVLSGLLTLVSLTEDQHETMERIIKAVDEKLMTWNKHTSKQRKSCHIPRRHKKSSNDMLSPSAINYNEYSANHEYKSDILYSTARKVTNKQDLRKSLARMRKVTRDAPSIHKKLKAYNKKHVRDKDDAYEIREWLFHALDCNKHYFKKYLPLFMHNRYDSLEAIKRMNEQDLIRIGIKKIEHRKQILSAMASEDDVVSEASTFTLSASAPTEAPLPVINQQFWARAISDYIITAADQLDLKMNSLYSILRTTPSGWWYASDMDGNHGWVPCNYLQKYSCSETQQLALAKSFTNITLESSDLSSFGPGY